MLLNVVPYNKWFLCRNRLHLRPSTVNAPIRTTRCSKLLRPQQQGHSDLEIALPHNHLHTERAKGESHLF